MTPQKSKGWHSRGYLPHFDGEGVTQFITFRLADSLPLHILNAWKQELEQFKLPDAEYKLELQRRIERHLDQGEGAHYLQEAQISAMVETSLYHRTYARVGSPRVSKGFFHQTQALPHGRATDTAVFA